MGRWWQVDPKIEALESLTPYSNNLNNPLRYQDPKGDCPPGSPCDLLVTLTIKLSQSVDNLRGASSRLMTQQSGNVPEHVEMDDATRKISKVSGTLQDANTVVKETKTIAKTTALEVDKRTAKSLENAGSVTKAAGYIGAPFTAGASLDLVPVGATIETVGSRLGTAMDVAEGNYQDAAVSVGTDVAFGKLGKTIENAEQAGKVSKTDATIRSAVTDTWNSITDYIYERSNEKK